MLDDAETFGGQRSEFHSGDQSVFQHRMPPPEVRPRSRIAKVSVLSGTSVRIVWTSGVEDTLDLWPALLAVRLQDRTADEGWFGRIQVSADGINLEWSDGSLLSSRWVGLLAELRMTNAEFRDAMRLLDLSYAGMAAQLGISERQVGNYRRDRPVPKHIALAVRYLLRLRSERHGVGLLS